MVDIHSSTASFLKRVENDIDLHISTIIFLNLVMLLYKVENLLFSMELKIGGHWVYC